MNNVMERKQTLWLSERSNGHCQTAADEVILERFKLNATYSLIEVFELHMLTCWVKGGRQTTSEGKLMYVCQKTHLPQGLHMCKPWYGLANPFFGTSALVDNTSLESPYMTTKQQLLVLSATELATSITLLCPSLILLLQHLDELRNSMLQDSCKQCIPHHTPIPISDVYISSMQQEPFRCFHCVGRDGFVIRSIYLYNLLCNCGPVTIPLVHVCTTIIQQLHIFKVEPTFHREAMWQCSGSWQVLSTATFASSIRNLAMLIYAVHKGGWSIVKRAKRL